MGRSGRSPHWVILAVGAVAVLLTAGLLTVVRAPAAVSSGGQWVGTWAAAPKAATPDRYCPSGAGQLSGRTVRNVITLSAGGSEFRVRLTNRFGTAPLSVKHASVGLSSVGAWLAPGVVRSLSFGGRRGVVIAAGQERTSDPVRLSVESGAHLAISVLADYRGSLTEHSTALQTGFVSGAGDATTDFDGAAYRTRLVCWLMADGVDVRAGDRLAGSVVALGDSITDGAHSTPNTDSRWPNVLARRLAARSGRTYSVVDMGISGNQLLTDSARFGPSVLHRLQHDVIDQPGVKIVIVMIGTNDIGFTDQGRNPVPATPARLEAGYTELVNRLHAAGIRVYASPLTPFLRPGPVPHTGYQDAAGEAMRIEVNRWIATSRTFDGLVNFAAAIAQPHDPTRMRAGYDSGDSLHPSDAGYRRMGEAVPLKWFAVVDPRRAPNGRAAAVNGAAR